jgi:putative pyruvate formate lyase activating enzyme
MGRAVDAEEFAGICLALQEKGAENINIVTGSHAALALCQGIEAARKQGLAIPVLWNSSGYDGMETLEIIKGFVDIYLPDLKTLDPGLASRFFNAPDYPTHAAAAIQGMMDFVESGLAKMVMVRHLVIPGYLENTRQVLRWFAENCQGRAQLSLMTQYTPVQIHGPGTEAEIPCAYVSNDEYDAVVSMLEEFGIEDGFCQELVVGSDWLPDFSRPNPFSSDLSVPVWHY